MDDHAVRGFEGTQAKITPSLACNNDCRFCYNRAEKALTRPLTEERVLELVDEAAATSPAQLNLIGGEVTILPYFLRVLRHARERFGVISVNTNGRRFADAAFAYEAVTAGLGEVDVSLHGATAAVHDHVSRAPGAWGETTAGLRNLVTLAAELGRPRVSVTTIVLDWNVHELNALGALLRELGVTSWRIKWAYGALGGHAADDPSEYIVPYTRGVAHVRKALATHGAALRVIVHDIPVCLLGDLMAYSTVHEQHTVARYGADGLEEHVAVVERWGVELDYEKVMPLLALDGKRIVADATLHRRAHGPLRLSGRVKWTIDPEFRGVGLGSLLINHFIDTARGLGLKHLNTMLITDLESDAIRVLAELGFRSYDVPGYGTDPDGNQHDMTLMVFKL
jgi:pyruvate-formate lyase-activating enzyme/GNAT superfamily N-acetyltransferase